MAKYADLVNPANVPQSEPLDERQVKNSAGGFTYSVDKWGRLDRFLILGSDSPTYYATARDLTKENAACVKECYAEDAERTVARIVEISTAGRAPKNDPAIFALALGAASKDVKVRQSAIAAVPAVCRTGTHIFTFVEIARALGRGWGRSLKRAVQNWYGGKDVDGVAFQAIKYRSRGAYSHARLLKTAHPPAKDGPERLALYRWIRGLDVEISALPAKVRAHLEAMSPETPKARVLDLVKEHDLPWEAVPTEYLRDVDFWKTVLPNLGLTALIRNLGTITELEVVKPLSTELKIVTTRLTDEAAIKKARVHPFSVLQALAVYKSGGGRTYGRGFDARKTRSWTPLGQIEDALDEAFYKAFQNVVPTGRRTMVCLDVSGSMSAPIMGSPVRVVDAAAAMAMVTMRTESDWHVMAFDQRIRKLPLTPKMTLKEVLKHTEDVNGGGTDCSLPMIYAMEQGLNVETFIVLTDNETWAGRVHPAEALRQYRKKLGVPNAKLIVVGMTATKFTIADPEDPGMLDVVGFDSAAPAIMADFAR